jgi:3-isopropylmalate/(R)-2-methylmalate dehydratase large subunit
MASDPDARYADRVPHDGSALEPIVPWGVNPGQAIGVSGRLPAPGDVAPEERPAVTDALAFMGFQAGAPIAATPIDVAFIGACTNSRLSDLREAAAIVKGHRISARVRGLVVPGSQGVAKAAVAEGLDQIFRDAGFEWRGAGCSMCLGMNPDKLQGAEVCASSSNRNFKGRQGSPTGRTLLMSPAMVAAAAIAGEVVDVRKVLTPALTA